MTLLHGERRVVDKGKQETAIEALAEVQQWAEEKAAEAEDAARRSIPQQTSFYRGKQEAYEEVAQNVFKRITNLRYGVGRGS